MHAAATAKAYHVRARVFIGNRDEQVTTATGTGDRCLGVAQHRMNLQTLPFREREEPGATAVPVVTPIHHAPIVIRAALAIDVLLFPAPFFLPPLVPRTPVGSGSQIFEESLVGAVEIVHVQTIGVGTRPG